MFMRNFKVSNLLFQKVMSCHVTSFNFFLTFKMSHKLPSRKQQTMLSLVIVRVKFHSRLCCSLINVSVIKRMYHHFRIQYVKVATVNCNWNPELIWNCIFNLPFSRMLMWSMYKTNGLHIHNSRPRAIRKLNCECVFAFAVSFLINFKVFSVRSSFISCRCDIIPYFLRK